MFPQYLHHCIKLLIWGGGNAETTKDALKCFIKNRFVKQAFLITSFWILLAPHSQNGVSVSIYGLQETFWCNCICEKSILSLVWKIKYDGAFLWKYRFLTITISAKRLHHRCNKYGFYEMRTSLCILVHFLDPNIISGFKQFMCRTGRRKLYLNPKDIICIFCNILILH